MPIRDNKTCSYLPAVEVTGEILGEIGAMLEGMLPLLDYHRMEERGNAIRV